MDRNLCVLLTVSLGLLPLCMGLDLVMNQDIVAVPGARQFCGVLTCTESINNSAFDTSVKNHGGLAVSFSSISSLSVFKRVPTRSRAGDDSTRDVPVASVTAQEPSVTRVANGRKVTGSLETGRATVRMEMVKRDDCQSEFTCHVRGLDSQGREAVSTASLVRQPDQRGNDDDVVDGRNWMPAVSLQLLASIQQLVTHSMAGLEDKIEQVEQRLADKIGDETEDKIGRLQRDSLDRSVSLERLIRDRLLSMENRLEDKIDNSYNLYTLTQLDSKISRELAHFRSESETAIFNSLDTLTQKLQDVQEQTLQKVSDNVEKSLENTSAVLSAMDSSFDEMKTCGQTDLLAVQNQTEALQKMLASGEVLSRRMWDDIIASNSEVLVNLRELGSNFLNCSTETRSEVRALLSDPEFWRSSDLESAVTSIARPKSCRKTSGFTSTHSSSPYTVIKPDPGSGDTFDFPVLCDTVSDGGGWIIIQRRATGNVDFNRFWAEYKDGFGSFYDDFWLGNDKIHAITSNGTYELDIKLRFQGKESSARYTDFSVAGEKENYRLLQVGSYVGTAGDSLTDHKGREFTTGDRDNDDGGGNCASKHGGGWWFINCDRSNLNGNWATGADLGVEWTTLAGANSVSYSEMKIRQV